MALSTQEGQMTEARPLCTCHGEPMRWNNDSSHRNGGRFKCQILRRKYNAATNARRIRMGGIYYGMAGFTNKERAAMLRG